MLSLATLTHLEHLYVLAGGSMDSSNVSDVALAEVLQGCQALKSISIVQDEESRDNFVYFNCLPILTVFQPMSSSRAPVLPNLTTLIVDMVMVLPARFDLSGCTSLKVLRCSLDINEGVEHMSSGELVSVLACDCPMIEVIEIHRSYEYATVHDDNISITDSVLSSLARGLLIVSCPR
jgi:hypothetical protein